MAKALMMNHKITPNGIPNDSIAAQSALVSPHEILCAGWPVFLTVTLNFRQCRRAPLKAIEIATRCS